jgi:hypothetical protein
VLRIESSDPRVKAILLPETDVPDEEGHGSASRRQIHVSVVPDEAPAAATATLTVHTNCARSPQVALNVTVIPEGAVTAQPPRLYFGTLSPNPDEPVARSIILVNHASAFQVLRAESSDPALHAQVMQPGQSANFGEVVVRYAGGWQPGRVRGTIVLATSDPLRPRVEVPFEAEVEAAAETEVEP